MKYSKYKLLIVLSLIFSGLVSCSKMDDYLKYTDGKDKLYTGKLDSVKIRSGRERVVVTGLLTSDPKVSRLKIAYNSSKDSVVMNIYRSAGVDTIKVPIALAEGTHSFEITTYDNQGNSSVTVRTTGRSYGNVYQQTLFNRAVKHIEKTGGDIAIDFYSADINSPFSRLTYTDINNQVRNIKVSNDDTRVTLKDFKSLTEVKLQSLFLPDSIAIDTFYAEPQFFRVSEDVTSIYLKNAGNPFQRAGNGSGKWDMPKDWLYNSNVLNQDGSRLGGWSWDNNGVIHFESKDWGGDGVNNGKLYQTFTLPAGKYAFEVNKDAGGGSINANFVVSKGAVIPDIDKLNDQTVVLGKYHWDENNTGGNPTVQIILNEPTQIAAGFVVSTGSYTWLRIKGLKLRLVVD
ncbi:DUF4998 domain-containing protein [Desertivirga arenae]|uniref:DUF4998 domain-containing protein n=1 Tax=Desertivirga arenae TaxID=2810309 RepID=UPI001A959555|nr:DUF4998 domain-containing protein [Pedobacter sp. SYSU D00823]